MRRLISFLLLPGQALAASFFSHISTIPDVPVAGQPFALRVVVYSDEHFRFADSTTTTSVEPGRLEITYFQPQTFAPLPPKDPFREVFVIGPYTAGTSGDVLGTSFDVEFKAPNAWNAFPPDVAGRARFTAVAEGDAAPLPGAGVWWNPAAPGVGYAIDVQDDFVFLVEFALDGDQPHWRTAQGVLQGGRFLDAPLVRTSRSEEGLTTAPVGRARLIVEHRSRAWLALDDAGFVGLDRFLTTATDLLGPNDQFPTPRLLPELTGHWLLIEHDEAGGGSSRVLEFESVVVDRSSGPLPIVIYPAGDQDGIFCDPNAFAFVPEQSPDLPQDLPPFESYSCRLMLDGRLDFTIPFDLDAIAPERIDLGADPGGGRTVLVRVR